MVTSRVEYRWESLSLRPNSNNSKIYLLILSYFIPQGKQAIYFFNLLLIIIVIRHVLSLDRSVSASCNIPFKSLPSRPLPIGPQFNTIFVILLLSILATCRSQFDLCLLSLLVSWFYFQLFQNFCIPFLFKKLARFLVNIKVKVAL
jgi:hypothetical protein